MNIDLVACPLTFAPPFVRPWRRALSVDDTRHLVSWCAELLPGTDVDIVEWVGADFRQPIHAVVIAFPSSHRSSIVLYRKVEDIEHHHLAQALCLEGAAMVTRERDARVRLVMI